MRKGIAVFCAAMLLLGLAGCSSSTHDNIYNDATALAGDDKYGQRSFTGTPQGEDQYSFSLERMSGADTIWTLDAQGGEEVTLRGSLEESNGGSIKLVLVDPADAVTTIAEASATSDSGDCTFTAAPGRYRVKVVGRDSPAAAGHFEYSHGALGKAQ